MPRYKKPGPKPSKGKVLKRPSRSHKSPWGMLRSTKPTGKPRGFNLRKGETDGDYGRLMVKWKIKKE